MNRSTTSPIATPPGKRIKLAFGGSSDQYLLITKTSNHGGNNHDTTAEESMHWNEIPVSLANRCKSNVGKRRSTVCFGLGQQNNEWVLTVQNRNSSDHITCWHRDDDHHDSSRPPNFWLWGKGGGDDMQESQARKMNFSQVSFGPNSSFVTITGTNGYETSCNAPQSLQKRLKKINMEHGTVYFVSLFGDGGYFIRDSIGIEWEGGSPRLYNEIQNGVGSSDGEEVVAVYCRDDETWLVLRATSFVGSEGIPKSLSKELWAFYRKENHYHVEAFKNKRRRAHERSEEHGRTEKFRAALWKRQVEESMEVIRHKKLKIGDSVTVLSLSEKQNDWTIQDIDTKPDIVVVNLKRGHEYLELEDPRWIVPAQEGDNYMPDVDNATTMDHDFNLLLFCQASDKYEAAISLYQCKCINNTCVCHQVGQQRRLSFLPHDGLQTYALPVAATGTPTRRQIGVVSTDRWNIGDRVHVIGYADATIIPSAARQSSRKIRVQYDDGQMYHANPNQLRKLKNRHDGEQQSTTLLTRTGMTATATATPSSKTKFLPLVEDYSFDGGMVKIQPFDEYKCAEKIDVKALRDLVEDLRTDSAERKKSLAAYSLRCNDAEEEEPRRKALQRCVELEAVAETLLTTLKGCPLDKEGCAVYEVEYEHRDPSCRGRLFAIGEDVRMSDGFVTKYPRTTTLQGMHSDLRARLVGKFGHDIDCENSEVRLLCSIAQQMNHSSLIENSLFEYRDNRQVWLDKIATAHNVEPSEAKRLPNIVINGGTYSTWLKKVGAKPPSSSSFNRNKDSNDTEALLKEVKKFIFRLGTEVRVLRDELLRHKRFQWTSIDRIRLKEQGKRGGQVDAALLPRIIQYCENEVLRILHRTFHQLGWIVRSKIFDGVIVERRPSSKGSSTTSLVEAMREAELRCRFDGWDVKLVEKELHGLQNQRLKSIEDARDVLSGTMEPVAYSF